MSSFMSRKRQLGALPTRSNQKIKRIWIDRENKRVFFTSGLYGWQGRWLMFGPRRW